MRLLEIIPTPESDADAVHAIAHFSDVRLGKGIVFAKDTPNFIANRIGTFSVLNIMRLMEEMDFTIEDVDALTGTVLGWPKSATFRTIDMVGLDVLGHVVRNMTGNGAGTKLRDERSELRRCRSSSTRYAEHKWLGDKTGGGFYKKIKGPQGEERLGLDWKTLEYRPRQKAKLPALEMAKQVEDMPQRVRMLLGLDGGGKLTAPASSCGRR